MASDYASDLYIIEEKGDIVDEDDVKKAENYLNKLKEIENSDVDIKE